MITRNQVLAIGGAGALILTGAVSAQAATAQAAGISGTWYNELCSVMNIKTSSDGGVTGNYESLVGQAKGKYVLTGRYDTRPPAGRGQPVGWTVAWRNQRLNSHSLTTWSGQYFTDGGERIITQWLLTSSTTAAEQWGSTRVGQDTFTRNRPPGCPEK